MVEMNEKWNPRESIRRARFTAHLIGNVSGKLLDIGAYKGELSEYLPIHLVYQPLDIYDLTKKFKNAVVQDLNRETRLPFKSNFFDVVVCIGTLEHLFHPEKVMAEIRRVLKPDGMAIISLPNDNSIYMKFLHLFNNLDVPFDELKYLHHWFFSKGNARAFVEKYFTVKEELGYAGIYGRYFLLDRNLSFAPEIFYRAKKERVE